MTAEDAVSLFFLTLGNLGLGLNGMSSNDSIDKVPFSALQDLEKDFLNGGDKEILLEDDGENLYPLVEYLNNETNFYDAGHLYACGGIKEIYCVKDRRGGREVAMARLRIEFCDDLEMQERFLLEARLTGRLSHPNIIPVYETGYHKNHPFFTMKLIKGDSLRTILRKLAKGDDSYRLKYGLSELMAIFLKICDAVAYAHSRGIAHLDLKPDNVRVNDFGEVLVCDWGLARIVSEPENDEASSLGPINADLHNAMTLTGTLKGTPGFMSPEQIDTTLGPKDQKSDIYALGSILYQILSWRRPLEEEADLETLLHKTLSGNIPAPSHWSLPETIPVSLEAVCRHAMRVRPSDRYESVSELIEDLKAYRNGFITSVEDAGLWREMHFLFRRHKTVFSSMMVIFVLTGVFTFYLYRKEKAASHHLAMYEREREIAEYFSQKGMDAIIANFRTSFRHNLPEQNHKIADYILSKKPENKIALGLKGLSYFGQLDYSRAREYMQASGIQWYNDLIQLSDEMLKKEDYSILFNRLQINSRNPLSSQVFNKLYQATQTQKEKEELISLVILSVNKKVTADELKFEMIGSSESIQELKIIAPASIRRLPFLLNQSIDVMEIENQKLFSFHDSTGLSVKKLIFRNCKSIKVSDMIPRIQGLQEVHFIGTTPVEQKALKLAGIRVVIKND